MSHTIEYKDNNKEWRLSHTAGNGNVTMASTEGYKNRLDLRTSTINACIQVLDHYREDLSEGQVNELKDIIKSLN